MGIFFGKETTSWVDENGLVHKEAKTIHRGEVKAVVRAYEERRRYQKSDPSKFLGDMEQFIADDSLLNKSIKIQPTRQGELNDTLDVVLCYDELD